MNYVCNYEEKHTAGFFNHIVTKSDIETLAEKLKKNIFENSNGVSELVSLTVLKLLVESLDKNSEVK